MRIQFLKAHEEFRSGKFACIPDDSAETLIEKGIAKEAPPYVLAGKAKLAAVVELKPVKKARPAGEKE